MLFTSLSITLWRRIQRILNCRACCLFRSYPVPRAAVEFAFLDTRITRGRGVMREIILDLKVNRIPRHLDELSTLKFAWIPHLSV